MKNLKSLWRKWRPSFAFEFDLSPLFAVRTHIMKERFDRADFEYCRAAVWVLKRKVLEFNLYRREF